MRFQSLTDKSVLESEPELFIHMQPDKTNNTLTIRDSGVGMTKADLVNNLGACSLCRRPVNGGCGILQGLGLRWVVIVCFSVRQGCSCPLCCL